MSEPVELSKEASIERARVERTRQAFQWFRGMRKTFKGQTGYQGRAHLAREALRKFKVNEDLD